MSFEKSFHPPTKRILSSSASSKASLANSINPYILLHHIKMEELSYLTCDEMDRAGASPPGPLKGVLWELFNKWAELTMKERGVNPKAWKKWIKDNKRKRIKCDKYLPTISVKEGKAKFKEIVK